MRGGEKVLEKLCEIFPDADIFTHVYVPERISETIRSHRVQTSFINSLPGASRHHQRYLPLMPIALEQFDLRGYDLVISNEAGPAKGVIVDPGAIHFCYCLSPMRYVWDMYQEHLSYLGAPSRVLMRFLAHYLRVWDATSAQRVSAFAAISSFVAQRVRTYYRRRAAVIFPPVDTQAFSPGGPVDDFYLIVSQLVPYKRVDLAVEAFKRNGRRLIVIGEGSEYKRLRTASAPNITFLGYQSFEVIRDHYARCRALIFPGVEDFGIVPVEAMASGRPTIAYRRGGVLDTILDGRTGLFFDQQSPGALNEALLSFEKQESEFSPLEIAKHAGSFSEARFKAEILSFVERLQRNGRVKQDYSSPEDRVDATINAK